MIWILLVCYLIQLVSLMTANERAEGAIRLSGGSCVCRTDLDIWENFQRSYWGCYRDHSACTDLRQRLYATVLSNYTRVFECNVGTVAGYALIGEVSLQQGETELAYRSYQMAMVFIYTIRKRQRIPVQQEILWQVSTDAIVRSIQVLRQKLPLPPIPEAKISSPPASRIGLVSICAYPETHPLILKDISPINRQAYASKHGYEALVAKSHPFGDGSNVCIQHSKLALMASLLESGKYDWLMWMDCDSIIVNQEKRIEDVIVKYASPATEILITEELLGLSSANWIIRNSEWSLRFLRRAFEISNSEIPYFGDQDAIISLAIGDGVVKEHVTIIPQNEINTYDALNAFYMNSKSYDVQSDLLITFPQCHDVACNQLFQAAFDASLDSARNLFATPIENRTWAQLRVFGPSETVAKIYEQHMRR